MTGMSRSLPKQKPRRKKLPSYLHLKPTGQARCRINGKDHYLGAYGSDESRTRYGELIASLAGGTPVAPMASTPADDDPGPSVGDLCVAFREFAKVYYSKNGRSDVAGDCVALSGFSPEPHRGPSLPRTPESG